MAAPASITMLARIEWMDTDAAGIYHWTTLFRFVEGAEAALHERLGIRERTFGRTPRVHVSCDFHGELQFFDVAELTLRVASVGESSLQYEFALRPEGTGEPVADGEMVIVHTTPSPDGRSVRWPDELRERLTNGGDQGRVDRR